MIYDNIANIETYKSLSSDIYEGLKFLRQVPSDIAVDTYQINPRVKAIVSEYGTKKKNEHGFEAHKKNIDIQYLLKGEERIDCYPVEKLIESTPYSKEKDAAFYSAKGVKAQEMTIGNGYFAIFFPQDGHMPCMCINNPEFVKKVVIKIKP